MVRILIADDHVLFREGMKSLLKNEDGIELIASASDGLEALELAGELRPDIVLMDVTLPRMNGIIATGKIVSKFPDIKVIVLSMHSDRRFIAETLKAGARGYLLKDSSPQTVVEAIRSVAEGVPFKIV